MGIDGWDSRSSRTEGVGVVEAEVEMLVLIAWSVVSSTIVVIFLRDAGAVISMYAPSTMVTERDCCIGIVV